MQRKDKILLCDVVSIEFVNIADVTMEYLFRFCLLIYVTIAHAVPTDARKRALTCWKVTFSYAAFYFFLRNCHVFFVETCTDCVKQITINVVKIIYVFAKFCCNYTKINF